MSYFNETIQGTVMSCALCGGPALGTVNAVPYCHAHVRAGVIEECRKHAESKGADEAEVARAVEWAADLFDEKIADDIFSHIAWVN